MARCSLCAESAVKSQPTFCFSQTLYGLIIWYVLTPVSWNTGR